MRKKLQSRSVFVPKKDFFVKFVKIFTIAGRLGIKFGITLAPYGPGVASKKLPYAGADRKSDRARVLRRVSALARCSTCEFFHNVKFFRKNFVNFLTITGKPKFSQKFHKKHLTFWFVCAILKNGPVRPKAGRQLYHILDPLSSIFFDNLVSICV